MPNAATLSSAVDTATKCLATAAFAASSPSSMAPDARSPSSSQLRASRALVSVSSVLKVLEATMNSVVAGSRSLVFSATSVGSMLETKRALQAGLHVRLQRLVDHHRAEVGAADADVDDGRDRLAGDAGPLPAADLVGEGVDLVEHLVHLGDDVDCRRRPGWRPVGRRSAVCSTARSSVTLMCSPANIASRRSARPTWSARSTRALRCRR